MRTGILCAPVRLVFGQSPGISILTARPYSRSFGAGGTTRPCPKGASENLFKDRQETITVFRELHGEKTNSGSYGFVAHCLSDFPKMRRFVHCYQLWMLGVDGFESSRQGVLAWVLRH